MTLQDATIEQLCDWQASIVLELASRCLKVKPEPVRAPWEVVSVRPIVARRMDRDDEIAALRAQLADAQRVNSIVRPAAPAAPPAMLGGQQPIQPGVVLATERTDPKYAAMFMAQPMRHEGIPGHQGNGKGEGQIDF